MLLKGPHMTWCSHQVVSGMKLIFASIILEVSMLASLMGETYEGRD
jgi:hypothetical protein